MKTEPAIPYGYKAHTGKVLSNYAVDTYNRLTDEINSKRAAGREERHLEGLLNERHRHFVMNSEINP